MKPEIIKAIFTNLLFVIGVILTIFGFVRGTLTVTRLATFDVYPLPSYEETRCNIDMMNKQLTPDGKEVETQEEQEKRVAACNQVMEQARNIRKVEDIATAISTLVAGVVLVFSFKRFIIK